MNTFLDIVPTFSLTFLAILIPVFVFAVSLLGRAIDKAGEDYKKKEADLKQKLNVANKNMQAALRQVANTGKTGYLEKQIAIHKKDKKKYEKDLKNIKCIPEYLTVKGCILKPGFYFLSAFILHNLAKYSANLTQKEILINLLNLISISLLAKGFWTVYLSLKVIQEISLTTEQAQLRIMTEAVERALQRQEDKRRPKLDVNFKDNAPPFIFKKMSKNNINWSVYLKSGDLATDCEIRFVFPDIFKCTGVIGKAYKSGYSEAVHDIGNIKRALQHNVDIEIEAPDTVGKFTFEYYLLSEEYCSDAETFEVEVV